MNLTFKFLSRHYKRGQCTCGQVYWTVTDDIHCGECSLKVREYYAVTHEPRALTKDGFRKAFTQYYRGKLVPLTGTSDSYQVVEPRGVRLSRGNIRYVNAGICIYTPHFMSGQEIPGYKAGLISYQPCVRFVDYQNVGVTDRHVTNFVMCGQHVFETVKKRFQDDWVEVLFTQLMTFFRLHMTGDDAVYHIHQSTWTDNRNRGNSLEIYVAGVEIANQVYTTEESDGTPLAFRYVDMGMGELRFLQLANKLASVYEVLGYRNKQLARLNDHLATLQLCYSAGIFPAKRNVGYNLRKMLGAVFKLHPLDTVLAALREPGLIPIVTNEHRLWLKH